MIEGNHKHSNSPNRLRHSITQQKDALVSLLGPPDDVFSSPETPGPPRHMSNKSRLPTPRTPGRMHDAMSQDTNWARTPPQFFPRSRRRLSGVNLAETIETAVENTLLKLDMEEGKINDSQRHLRMKPRFESKELADKLLARASIICATIERDRPLLPPPAPPLNEEEEETKQEVKQEVEHEDKQEAKAPEQQQETVENSDNEGSSGIHVPMSKFSSLNLKDHGEKLSEAAPKVLPAQRRERPRRRMSAPSA